MYFEQVVVNPFIWSRMQRPGQSVPFLFDNFKPDQSQKALAAPLPEQRSQTRALSARQSREEVLQIVATIVQQLVGAQVCHVLAILGYSEEA